MFQPLRQHLDPPSRTNAKTSALCPNGDPHVYYLGLVVVLPHSYTCRGVVLSITTTGSACGSGWRGFRGSTVGLVLEGGWAHASC